MFKNIAPKIAIVAVGLMALTSVTNADIIREGAIASEIARLELLAASCDGVESDECTAVTADLAAQETSLETEKFITIAEDAGLPQSVIDKLVELATADTGNSSYSIADAVKIIADEAPEALAQIASTVASSNPALLNEVISQVAQAAPEVIAEVVTTVIAAAPEEQKAALTDNLVVTVAAQAPDAAGAVVNAVIAAAPVEQQTELRDNLVATVANEAPNAIGSVVQAILEVAPEAEKQSIAASLVTTVVAANPDAASKAVGAVLTEVPDADEAVTAALAAVVDGLTEQQQLDIAGAQTDPATAALANVPSPS